MSGETEDKVSGWTVDTTREHFRALAEKDEQIRQSDHRWLEERDRRYNEVNIEKEKALKIKEKADLAALQLAREIQTYKDEKANELREQINSERGLYATKGDLAAIGDKIDAQLKPLTEYVSFQRGGGEKLTTTGRLIAGGIAVFASLLFIIATIVALTQL